MSRFVSRTAFVMIPILLACATTGANKGGIDLISIDEEIKLGNKLADEISKRFEIIKDKQISDYFQQVGRGIADNSDWSGLDYQFSIINTSAVNAFSVLGGHVFISRGLIEQADNLSEVASIIAHEIGHIVSRHGTKQLMKVYGMAVSAQSILGENPDLYRDIIDHLFKSGGILDYGEKNELKASELAVKYAWKTGYDPRGLISILEKIQVLEMKNISSVAQYQLTHPRVDKRLNRVLKVIENLSFKSGLKVDTVEFHEIKERLKNINR